MQWQARRASRSRPSNSRSISSCSSIPDGRRMRQETIAPGGVIRRGGARRYNSAMQRAPQPGEAAVSEVSKLLRAWGDGDQSALERLTPFVYDALHRLARRYMTADGPGHTLQTRS